GAGAPGRLRGRGQRAVPAGRDGGGWAGLLGLRRGAEAGAAADAAAPDQVRALAAGQHRRSGSGTERIMDRRRFLRAAGAALGPALFVPGAAVPAFGGRAARSGAADLLLRGALVYDGTGAPPVEADVRVSGDRIAGVGARLAARGAPEVDLRGLAVAPGFIDLHAHTDLVLLVNPRAESKVRQGVTTEVAGQDGGSVGPVTEEAFERRRESYRQRYGVDLDFRDLGGFFRRLDTQGAAVNLASMVGAGTIRGYVVGLDDRPATPEELARMVALVEEALRQGACGLSSGLEYTPGAFADRNELVALARALRGTGLPYASHM